VSCFLQDKKENSGVAVHMTLEKMVGKRAIKEAKLQKDLQRRDSTAASNQA